MSTRTRIILELNGRKHRGGEAWAVAESRMPPVYNSNTEEYERPKLYTLAELQAVVKQWVKKDAVRLLVLREPRRVKPERSLYKTMLGLHEKRRNPYVRAVRAVPPMEAESAPLWSVTPTTPAPAPNMAWIGLRWQRI